MCRDVLLRFFTPRCEMYLRYQGLPIGVGLSMKLRFYQFSLLFFYCVSIKRSYATGLFILVRNMCMTQHNKSIDILDVYLRTFSLRLMNISVWFPILSIQAGYLCKQVFCVQNSPIVERHLFLCLYTCLHSSNFQTCMMLALRVENLSVNDWNSYR